MRKCSSVVVLTFMILAIVCQYPLCLYGQDKNAPSAPVPAQLQTAKRIFISNGGADAIAAEWLGRDDALPYNLVFNRAKSSGRYELVLAPADADLVWYVKFVVSTTASGMPHSSTSPDYHPQLRLTIVDPKTHIVLWTMTTKVETAMLHSTLVKNVETAVDALLRKLTAVAAPPTSSTQ